jgi:GDP-mannose transporter
MSKTAVVTTFAVVGYGACSSLMLVVNKVCVHLLPAPSFVLLAQFFCSWVAVKACGVCGCIVVDQLEWGKLKAFLPISIAFLAAVFANIKTLQFANVETFVVFRASTPLTIAVCEYLCLGRELPNARSFACLLTLLVAAAGYVLTDAHFVVHGYVWVGVWYVIFCFDQLYIKHAVDNVKVDSNWGRVFYTNLWAFILAPFPGILNEPEVLQALKSAAVGLALTPLELADVPFAEQVQHFRRAAVVTGMHGAGYANIIVLAPRAVVAELCPLGYCTKSYERMSARLDLIYMRWTNTIAENAKPGYDTVVDVGQFTKLMQQAVSAFRSESPSVASDEERGGAGHDKEEEEEEEAETTFLIGSG